MKKYKPRQPSSRPDSGLASQFVTLDQAARMAGWWFADHPAWVRRRVESIKLESGTMGFVRSTIDIELPHGAPTCAWDGSQRLFLVPVGLVTKEPRASQFELLDERWAAVPVFTRHENAQISAAGLHMLASQQLGGVRNEKTKALAHFLSKLAASAGREAGLYAGFAAHQFEGLKDKAKWSEGDDRLLEVISALAANSVLWTPLVGLLGAQRTVQLLYHMEFKASPILKPWRPYLTIAMEDADGTTLVYKNWREPPPPESNRRKTARRIWNRIAHSTNFSAFQLWIQKPSIHDAFSFHVQVEAPPAVDVRHMYLLGRLAWPSQENGHVHKRAAGYRGHLYFSNASSIETESIGDRDEGRRPLRPFSEAGKPAVLIHLRIGRRGPIFFPAAIAALVTALLWLMASHPGSAFAHSGVAAATLLAIPAVLLVFAYQVGEHRLITQLLSGVRILTSVVGICAVMAAAVLFGVEPWGHVKVADPASASAVAQGPSLFSAGGSRGASVAHASPCIEARRLRALLAQASKEAPSPQRADLSATEVACHERIQNEEVRKSAAQNWHDDSILAGIMAIMLLLGWILAFRWIDGLRKYMRAQCRSPVRYSTIVAAALALQAAVVWSMPHDGGHNHLRYWLYAIGFFALVLFSGWVAAYGEVPSPPVGVSTPLLAALSFLALGAIAVFLHYDFQLLAWHKLHTPYEFLLAAGVVLAVVKRVQMGRRFAGGGRSGGQALPEPLAVGGGEENSGNAG
jgi:hypothetical protein